jgi:asparagine synthase (glutamine-hydrolysing)
MPGIVGIINLSSGSDNSEALEEMLALLKHESFYRLGSYSNPNLGVSLGWAALEGSFSDCMPAWNESKDICLIFSGESFLDSFGINCLQGRENEAAENNASYLVHLYEKEGIRFVERLNGWFNGVIVDLRAKKVILFNDRYGLNRIYLHEGNGKLYFSSEAKSLLRVLPELRRLDERGFAEASACGCVLQNRTLFAGIVLLPGASIWSVTDYRLSKISYFRPEAWENQQKLTDTEYYDRLREVFPAILRKYISGKQNLGMSLTGGLDGRMIMSWAKFPANTLPCYTFDSSYRSCLDAVLAQKTARICDQPHRTIPVDGEFLSNFPALAQRSIFLSDGALDVSGAVELYVNQIARRIAPVRITGNYGSEILRGNVAFKADSRNTGFFTQSFRRLIEAAHETYHSEAKCHPVTFIAFKQVPWHHYSRLSVEQSQLSVRSPYLDNELVSLIYQAPRSAITSKQHSLRLIAEGNPRVGMLPTDRGLRSQPIPLLTKLQNFYREFTFKAEYAYDYGMPQWLAKVDHVLSPLHLEKLFLGRHKFYHFRVWYRDQLSSWVKEILLDGRSRSRNYLDWKVLEKMVENHGNGTGNFTREIHTALTMELIQRELIEEPPRKINSICTS